MAGIQRTVANTSATFSIGSVLRHRFSWLLGTLVGGMLIYLPTTASLAHLWNAFGSRYYTHGDLILLMSVLALVRRRATVDRTAIAPRLPGALLLLPLSLGWLLSYQSTIQIAHQVLLPLILLDLVYALYGWGMARVCWFPIAFLYFGIPVWDWIVLPLRWLTVTMVGYLLPLAGIPVLIVGDIVHIPAGSFEIAAGCAGEMYMIIALALAAYYGDQLRATPRHRAILMIAAAMFAMLGNWLRVCGVIIAGQLTAMHSYLVRVSHDEFGWAIFGVAMLAFGLLAHRIATERHDTQIRAVGGIPPRRTAAWWAPAVLAALCVLAGPVWRLLLPNPATAAAPITQFGQTGEWLGPLPSAGTWRPVFDGADSETSARYLDPRGEEILLYAALYLHQSQTVKLHRAGNSLLGEDMPQVGAARNVGSSPFRELEFQTRSGEPGLVWATYSIGHRTTPSLIRAQLWYSAFSLTRPAPIAVIALQTTCRPDCAGARYRLQGFITASPWLLRSTD